MNRKARILRLGPSAEHPIPPEARVGIDPVWRGAWLGADGSSHKVQPVLGEGKGGYHAGIAHYEDGKVNVDWGPPTKDRELAKALAQVGATTWLDGQRQQQVEELKRARGWDR